MLKQLEHHTCFDLTIFKFLRCLRCLLFASASCVAVAIVPKIDIIWRPVCFCFAVGTTRAVWACPTWPGSRAACARITARRARSARTLAIIPICGRTAPSCSEHSVRGSVRRTPRRAVNAGSFAAPRATARTRSTIITKGRKAPWLPRLGPSCCMNNLIVLQS